MNISGIVNATGGGCPPGEGDGGGKEINCCHQAGGSYGGKGDCKLNS